MTDTASAVASILAALKQRPEIYLIGIGGIPGSGKTTLALALAAQVPGAVVVPMDGYHLPRRRLDAEGLRRRGAPHTFDSSAFHADMERLRRTHRGSFPGFDHAKKDPCPGAVRVTPGAPLVIVEGLYVLMRDWRAEPLFDLRVFLDCDPDEAVERLTLRHLATGVAATPEESRQRATTSDRLNAGTILADGCRERADLVLKIV
jgi:pantothenate kinase